MVEDYSLSYAEISRIAYEKEIPLQATIELLTRCNFKCSHCYIPKHDNFGLDKNKILSILSELRKMGTLSLVLTGGEICLRKDLIEIVKEARAQGFSVSLLTNAHLLREKMIDEFSDLHVNSLGVTIFFLDEKINDEITKYSNSLPNILKNVEYAVSKGIRVEIKMPVFNVNKDSIKELFLYTQRLGCEFIPTTSIFPRSDGSTDGMPKLLNREEFVYVNNQIDKIFKREIIPVDTNEENLCCPSLRSMISIDASGNVFPCNSFYFCVGNVNKNSLKEIWEFKIYKKIRNLKRKTLTRCNECSVVERCTRCPGRALLIDKNLYGCSSMDRRYAELYTANYCR